MPLRYRRAALDDPPAHKDYVVTGAASGNANCFRSQPAWPIDPFSKRHALVARVFLGTSKVPFPSFALRLLNEPLPFLSHFGQKRFEARISCRASFLKASRRKSLIPSGGLHFPTPNERRWAEVLITDCSKLKMVGAGGLLFGQVDFEGVLCCPKTAGDRYAATCGLARKARYV
jgi:hypothetical protein